MTDQMTAVQYGVGPIGSRIVRAGHQQGIEFVGAIDIDPQKLGRDLGDVAGCNESLDVTVTDDASAVLGPDIDMVFHSTVSSLQMAMPQLRECLEAGVDVISTCEQLTFPQYRHPDLATELDQVATTNEVSIMGTGINPGYAMDFLPTVLTIPCHTVKSIEVLRVQNASTRREPLQRKVGAGLSLEAFEEQIVGQEGHVGLTESVAMIAHALGWTLDEITEDVEPVIAEAPVRTDYFEAAVGEVAGMAQRGVGRIGGTTKVDLQISQYIGAPDARDVIQIHGDPSLMLEIPGGIHGDRATPAVVVNSAGRVRGGTPGLLSMVDGLR
jgi:4-hydroxy-tetrahydrodipicolinate reductase